MRNGMTPELGIFVVPAAADWRATLAHIEAANAVGLRCVAVQDHPYQRRSLDTWTLLSFAAARTRQITPAADVACLPLRAPAMLAKAAASLDLLSEGRVEVGLGAGGFWDAIEAFGVSKLLVGLPEDDPLGCIRRFGEDVAGTLGDRLG